MHASEKADVRDILDCDYKVIAQIVNMLLDPISSKQRQLDKWALVSHCQSGLEIATDMVAFAT